MELLIDILGWIGAIEVLAAYMLISFNKLRGSSVSYQLLNLTGGMFLIVNTIFKNAYPSAFVNVIWVGIALYALVKKKK